MFPNLAREANSGRNEKLLILLLKMVSQLLPCRHAENDAEMSGRDCGTVYGIRLHFLGWTVTQMQGYLVAKEIQVNPSRCGTSFATAQQAAIKSLCNIQV